MDFGWARRNLDPVEEPHPLLIYAGALGRARLIGVHHRRLPDAVPQPLLELAGADVVDPRPVRVDGLRGYDQQCVALVLEVIRAELVDNDAGLAETHVEKVRKAGPPPGRN
jgi:hypothetical protein